MLIRSSYVVHSFLLLVFLFVISAGTASAQSNVGVRAGISADPEQFYFGAHVNAAEIVKYFWFRPNAEVGFGDSQTVATLNGEFVYLLRQKKDWTPYFGGGPAIVIRSFRNGPGARNTDSGPGFNFVGGVQKTKGLMAEVKLGVLDSPGFKLGIGWTW